MKEPPKFSFDSPFSPEKELEGLLKSYRDTHNIIYLSQEQQKGNEYARITTESNLYAFNVGLLMGMRWKK